MQTSVHGRFRDQSTNVREASVDLIGQFVLKCPDLTDRYYDMIMERILVRLSPVVAQLNFLIA